MLRTSGFAFERRAKDPSLLLKRLRTHCSTCAVYTKRVAITTSRLSSISRETRDIGEIMMTVPNAPDGRSDSHGTYAMRHRQPL